MFRRIFGSSSKAEKPNRRGSETSAGGPGLVEEDAPPEPEIVDTGSEDDFDDGDATAEPGADACAPELRALFDSNLYRIVAFMRQDLGPRRVARGPSRGAHRETPRRCDPSANRESTAPNQPRDADRRLLLPRARSPSRTTSRRGSSTPSHPRSTPRRPLRPLRRGSNAPGSSLQSRRTRERRRRARVPSPMRRSVRARSGRGAPRDVTVVTGHSKRGRKGKRGVSSAKVTWPLHLHVTVAMLRIFGDSFGAPSCSGCTGTTATRRWSRRSSRSRRFVFPGRRVSAGVARVRFASRAHHPSGAFPRGRRRQRDADDGAGETVPSDRRGPDEGVHRARRAATVGIRARGVVEGE